MFQTNSLPKVLVLFLEEVQLENASQLDCQYVHSIEDFVIAIQQQIPDLICTIHPDGWTAFKELNEYPNWIKCRWFHYESVSKIDADYLYERYMRAALERYGEPTFSICTPIYNPTYLNDAAVSIMQQSINDWEWVIVDDSPEPCLEAQQLAQQDLRIRYIRYPEQTGGNIGLSKWRAFSNARGKWLIELDHDDELFRFALSQLLCASKQFPDSGFLYSDFVDIDKNGSQIIQQYGDEYAFGYAHTYPKQIGTTEYIVNESPNINSVTARHIVGMPNHIRCWHRDIYFGIGGHNQNMRIADDYELLVRTFLATRFTRIKYPLYKQRFDGNNTQDPNREDIQIRVHHITDYYNQLIHKAIEQNNGYDLGYDPETDSYEGAYALHGDAQPHCNNIYFPVEE